MTLKPARSAASIKSPLASVSHPNSTATVTSVTWLFIQVSTVGGEVRRKGVPLALVSAADITPSVTLTPKWTGEIPVKITVENASIDRVGLLRVHGWVVSLAPLAKLQLFLGEEALGLPELGLSRPDVAARHREFPQSANCGFRLIQDIATEHPVLRILATTIGGLTRQIIMPVAFPHDRQPVTLDGSAIDVCVDILAVRPDGSVLAAGWAVAAAGISRRDAYVKVGGFNEAHSVVYNDLDYCLRMWRSGQRVLYTPFDSLMHHELASRASISDVFDKERFDIDWGGVFLKGDPYFNPNLSTESDDYAVETETAEVVYAAHPLIHGKGVKAILAVKLDHIGDFIIAMPAFRRLKQRFPEAKRCVLASRASRSLAAMEPAIDEVIEFDFFHTRSGLGRRDITLDELEVLRSQLAERRFDIAVDLRLQPDTRDLLRHTGARLLAGFDHAGQFPWLDVALEWEGDTPLVAKRTHMVDRLGQLVEAIAIACDADRAGVEPMDRDEAWLELHQIPAIAQLPVGFLDKPLVCVHPAVGNDTRQWPEEHFGGLIDLLVAEHDVHVALIGGKEEIPVAEKLLANVQHKSAVVSMLGGLSLCELPLLLRVAVLYVGNNSGPKHLAAAMGTPTVGVHSGVVDATEWGPFGRRAVAIRRKTACSPCYIAAASDCHRNLACLRKLRPGEVYDVCRTMLVRDRHLTQASPVGGVLGTSVQDA